MTTYNLGNDITIKAPEGYSMGGAVDLAVQRGHLTPQEAEMLLEGQISAPEISSGMEAFGLNVADFVAQRSQGLIDPVSPQTLSQGERDFPKSTLAGEVAPYVAAGIAAPASLAGQGLMMGGLEAVREGSTIASTGAQGALGVGGAFLGNAISRVGGGMASRVVDKIKNETSKLTGAAARTMSEAFPNTRYAAWVDRAITDMGGFDPMQQARQKILNEGVAKSFGGTVDEFGKIGPDVLREGFDRIGGQMDELIPDRVRMSPGGIKDDLAELNIGSDAKRILGRIAEDATDISGQDFKALRRLLNDRAVKLMRTDPVGAEDMFKVVSQLDEGLSGTLSKSAVREHRRLREQYKNLMIASKSPSVAKFGEATVSDTLNGLKADAGYGRTFKTMRTDNLLPETADLMKLIRELASFGKSYPNSGTAARNLGISALSGDPKSATQAVLAPLAGKASQIGAKLPESLPGAEKAGAILAEEEAIRRN